MIGNLALLLSLQVTYVANEGFLIASGEDKVLIDALQSGGIEEYLAPSPSTLDELQRARGSFRGVDLVLVSHRHVDHFDPAVVARHVESNADARLISTSQMVGPVRDRLSSDAARDVWSRRPT
jgi:L-ascorbate metabolism protein UlaG (beta-lactamase superfamily)